MRKKFFLIWLLLLSVNAGCSATPNTRPATPEEKDMDMVQDQGDFAVSEDMSDTAKRDMSIIMTSDTAPDSGQGWKTENLSQKLWIALPETGYPTQAGFSCGDDSCAFKKERLDKKVAFDFETGPGAIYKPAVYDVLPTEHTAHDFVSHYKTKSFKPFGLYYSTKEGQTPRDSYGVVIFDNNDGKTYSEVLFLEFDFSEIEEVVAILKTMQHKIVE